MHLQTRLMVQVQPNAKRNEVLGFEEGKLKLESFEISSK
jgi:uncharacterized protein YggU (UPF0235/DUF167 family)